MVELQIRDCDFGTVKLKVAFIASNTAPQGPNMIYIDGVRTNKQRVGDYSYYEAYSDLNLHKISRGYEDIFKNPLYDIEGLKANNYARGDPFLPRARALIQGVGAALNYAIARGCMDITNKIVGKQNHLVISAPPGNLQTRYSVSTARRDEDPVGHVWERYLIHRGTRMADSYCTTLSMNPSWQVQRVIATDICQFFAHKECNSLPLESINPSIIEGLNKCSHIHIFDDHIVYGDTMENLLHSVCSLLAKFRVSPWPRIYCVSWFSVMDRPIRKIMKRLTKGEWKHESESEIMPQLRNSGKMFSDISLGSPPPVRGMFPIDRLDSDESSFYCTYINHKSNFTKQRLPVDKRVLDWYEFRQS
jgi:hypothetical protein